MFQRVFRYRRHDWILPAVLCAVLVVLWIGGEDLLLALRYEHSALTRGQWWRLITGHFVHAGWMHLGWNLLGIALVWSLFAADYAAREWLAIMLASILAIDLGFGLLQADLDWYVGFSGVLHGCIAAGLLAWLRVKPDWLTAVVALIFAAKLVWEHSVGPLALTASSLSVPVIHEAHSYGAIGGALCGAGLLIRRTRRDGRL